MPSYRVPTARKPGPYGSETGLVPGDPAGPRTGGRGPAVRLCAPSNMAEHPGVDDST